MKKAVPVFLCLLCVLLPLVSCKAAPAADVPAELSPGELEEAYDTYLKPLVPTTVIGMPWESPGELPPDDVIVTYEIKLMLTDRPALDAAEEEGVCRFGAVAVEAYTAEAFGMTAGQTREASYYDEAQGLYLVPEGVGGAWGVQISGASRQGDLLDIRYELINALDEVAGEGVMRIRLNGNGSWTYLSNVQQDVDWES